MCFLGVKIYVYIHKKDAKDDISVTVYNTSELPPTPRGTKKL